LSLRSNVSLKHQLITTEAALARAAATAATAAQKAAHLFSLPDFSREVMLPTTQAKMGVFD